MARRGKTEPIKVCLDADVVIAGLFSRAGASHAILVLGETGLLDIVIPAAAVEEVRRNLEDKLPEALPRFEQFLRAGRVAVHRPSAADARRARPLAHAKDRAIMAAAIGGGARLLVTHNVRHFTSSDDVRVLRPKQLVEEARAWMARFGTEPRR